MRRVWANPATESSISKRFSPAAAESSKRGRSQLRGINVPAMGAVTQGAPSLRGVLPSNSSAAFGGADGSRMGVEGKSVNVCAEGPASTLDPPVAPPVLRPPVPPSPVEVPASLPPVPVPCETERDRPATPPPPVIRQRATIDDAIGNQESLRTWDCMPDLRLPRAGRRVAPDGS